MSHEQSLFHFHLFSSLGRRGKHTILLIAALATMRWRPNRNSKIALNLRDREALTPRPMIHSPHTPTTIDFSKVNCESSAAVYRHKFTMNTRINHKILDYCPDSVPWLLLWSWTRTTLGSSTDTADRQSHHNIHITMTMEVRNDGHSLCRWLVK